jgi:glycosyltransferase involved in cell wall biosynthesis
MAALASRRVLCVSPFFAPIANAEAFCGAKVALALAEAGVELSVISVDYAAHPKYKPDPSGLWGRLREVAKAIPPDGGRSKSLSIPLGLRYLTPEWSRWVHATVGEALRQHRAKPFDVLYSRGLPNIAHVATYWIARALRVPWVANFNDPWDLEGAHLLPQDRHKRKRTAKQRASEWWMQRVMQSADVLTFPCARLRDYHLRLAAARGRCEVIPHIGWPADQTEEARDFRLVHAGNLGAGESTRRNSTVSLLRAMRSFFGARPAARSRVSLVLVGPEDRATLALAEELGLAANVACTGRVSYEESLRRMRMATVCLLVEGSMPEGIYLPSKFPDYVQNGKPVVALSPLVGTIADLLPARGLTVVHVEDSAGIEASLARHYDAFVAGTISELGPADELRHGYGSAQVGQRLAELFEALAPRRS